MQGPRFNPENEPNEWGLAETVLTRVLADRQQQLQNMEVRHPLPFQEGVVVPHAPGTVSVRIYVATRDGKHLLVDDRAELACMQSSLNVICEIVEAEYVNLDPAAIAKRNSVNATVACPSECKGEMLYMLGQDCKRRPKVDYVAFIDDDIKANVSDLLRSAHLAKQAGINLYQLCLSNDSEAVWPQLKQQQGIEGDALWEQVRIVEIMAPVIAWQELENGLLDVLSTFKSGFGWDSYLVPCLMDLFPDFRCGLYLRSSMEHKRKVNTNNQTIFSNKRTALEEEDMLRASIALTISEKSFCGRADFLALMLEKLERPCKLTISMASALQSSSKRYWMHQDAVNELHVLENKIKELKQDKKDLEATIAAMTDRYWEMEERSNQISDQFKELNIQFTETQRKSYERLQKAIAKRNEMSMKLGNEILRCREQALIYLEEIEAIKTSRTWIAGKWVLWPAKTLWRLINKAKDLIKSLKAP